MWRRLLIINTLGALALILVILLVPVHNKFYNVALLLAIIGAWTGFLLIFWKSKYVRFALVLVLLVVMIPFILPGGEINKTELRKNYVQRMATFEGTNYSWGGESPRGIDCSGLPRRALRDALFSYGINHVNGRAMRLYLEHWWFDASAKALGEGYRGYTLDLDAVGKIKEIDCANFQPGDIAITFGGAHLIVYAGEGQWIQADPGVGSVISLNGRTGDNNWFKKHVTMHRWSILDLQE